MTTSKAKRAFGYVRLSKDDQATTSPARQREHIRNLCRDRGWDLVEMFEDIDVSANAKHRPAFEQMMSALDECDAIVFWKLDRLSRSVLHFSKILEQTQAAKVALVSTSQPIDTASAMGRAFVQMTAMFAELEVATVSERALDMQRHKRERGEWSGRVPYGFALDDERKRLVPVPEQVAVLRDAAKRYVAGETWDAIARRHGVNTGGTLRRMLDSDRVLDLLPSKLRGELEAALHTRGTDRSNSPTSAMSLLGGIARCGECGGRMVHSSTRGRSNAKQYRQYRCPTAGHVGISSEWLADYVGRAVVDVVDTGRVMDTIRKRRATGDGTPKVAELEARLAALDDRYTAGRITEERYDRMNASLVEQLAAAKAETRRNGGPDLPLELAHDLAGRWDDLSVADRRRIIAAVVDHVEVRRTPKRGTTTNREDRVTIVWRVA